MKIQRSSIRVTKSSTSQECASCPFRIRKEDTCATCNTELFNELIIETELSIPCSGSKISFVDKIAQIWRLNKGDYYLYHGEVLSVKFGYKNKLLDRKSAHECLGVPISKKTLSLIFYDEGPYAYFERVSVPYRVRQLNDGTWGITNKSNETVAKVKYIHEIQAFVRQTRKANASI